VILNTRYRQVTFYFGLLMSIFAVKDQRFFFQRLLELTYAMKQLAKLVSSNFLTLVFPIGTFPAAPVDFAKTLW
jgi:hypothetical protein